MSRFEPQVFADGDTPMSYCVALFLEEGLVMLADTRTNAGVDNIATFGKLTVHERAGERVFAMMSAGNLAITQSAINILFEGIEDPRTGEIETLDTVPTMFKAAQLAGKAIRQVYALDGPALQQHGITFDGSLLLGGQIRGGDLQLFQIYAPGNFIEATPDTPYLQTGEMKYGKPILDRAVTYQTPIFEGVKLGLISMDSTLRSNLTVGLPIDLVVIRRGTCRIGLQHRVTEQDEGFRVIREQWSEALKIAYRTIPQPAWLDQTLPD